MHQLLRSYLKKLTNLTGGNRSILLLKSGKEQDLDLHEINYNNDAPSIELIRQLVSGKKKIFVGRVLDSRDGKSNELSKKFRRIERREHFVYEERGAKDLYIGWPFVRGKLQDGNLVRCPLLFFPVTLRQEDNKWYLIRREEETMSFNKSFLLAYSYFNQVRLEDDFMEMTFEDFDTDLQVFITQLYQLIKDSPLELNFNQELFSNQLTYFEQFKKSDFEEKYENGELKLFPEALLGLFPQAGSFLVPDYEALLEHPGVSDLEEFFWKRTIQEDKGVANSFQYLTRIREEQTFTPFRVDASQENALKAVKKGNSMVVIGPPGTGKSQLICNLISDYIARGKKVLLVCQKKAALDVVYERLREKEISDFIGLVHDFKNDRQHIYAQIASQIDRLDEYKYKNNSLDSIQLERTFLTASRKIDQLTEELEEFKQALYDEKECGVSVKELYLTCSPDGPSIDLHQEFNFFQASELEAFPYKIRSWFAYARRFMKKDYLWEDRKDFRDFTLADLRSILELLDEIPYYQAAVSEELREILGASFDLEDCEWFAGREELFHQIIGILDNPGVFRHFQHYFKRDTDADELLIREKKILGCFREEGLEESLPGEQLGAVQIALQKAANARKQPFYWFKWRLFSNDKFAVKRVFVANQLAWDKEGFRKLIQRVDNRMNYEHNLTRLKEMGWLYEIPEDKDPERLGNWFYDAHTALAVKAMVKELRNLKEFMDMSKMTFPELRQRFLQILEVVRKIPEDRKRWMQFLTARQISRILYDYEYALELKTVLKRDFDSLAEFDRLTHNLNSHELSVMKKLYEHGRDLPDEQLSALFANSIRLEWINHIETKYPVLRSVASLRMQQIEDELKQAVREKLHVSRDIVLLRTRERTYRHVDYNRLNNMVTYRDLRHQVTKKKKIWPIRKLISAFHTELFDLIPCWMASPESVSAIFPMQTLFDLVIFDEASQCYAEKGIPAMYRGHQIVITGDDKQLSPSDLYQTRWEEEESEIPDLELDSLLNLASAYLMEVQLRGHYRSRSLELIHFSNKHFYNNRLQLLPHFNDVQQKEPPIKYIKTEGVWEDQSNMAEAERVVALVADLLGKEPGESIGVVTFNYRQQQLIAELLEERFMQKGILIPESLFVKNIENVQGDERDSIIFSVGYAPDKKGKMSMNFGSLNAPRGENRLNVAITRARKAIYLVSSILPHQLNVENARHEGPRMLKKYLEYSWTVSMGEFRIQPLNTSRYSAGWLLKSKLNDLTYDYTGAELEEEFPFADLTFKVNNQYKGLILTDDNLYLQSISAKDSHAYLPLDMKEKSWQQLRVYSREYWSSREQIKEKISRQFLND